jgi:DNA polymerase-4
VIRRILHIDMDAFYASVEQRDDPSLRGKPVAVGGQPTSRGVVAAASYEARAFGVRSAMPMSRAVRLCPSLMIVRPDFSRYKAASSAVFAIFREVTPLVEPLSLDEAYLDVTENAWGEALGVTVARRLKTRILEETGLTASAGVAPNKFLAKIASGWKKPNGLTVISPDRVEPFLQKLGVDALWGVGPVTARKLRARGVDTLVDVRAADPQLLREAVGSLADWLKQLAAGIDERPVVPNREAKSSASESTYPEDLTDIDAIRAEIACQASHAIGWLTRRRLLARTVTIKVRYDDFTTITRSHTAPATRDEAELTGRAVRLLEKTEAGARPVRLLGVSVHNFCGHAAADPDRLPFESESYGD